MKLDQHYVDPRLVELYDLENVRGADTDFYLRLAAKLDARRILDLGCGTGVLTRELAAVEGRSVTGMDPAHAMLAVARRPPGAERVQWVEGDAGALGTPAADLVVMTGNVAQVFLDDAEWTAALSAIYAALGPGGHLAFESRNPADRAWERWTPAATYARIASPFGPMECWLEVVSVENGRVRIDGHNVFATTGEVVVASSELRFRSQAELTHSLTSAGFTVEFVYGDWEYGPLTLCPDESGRFLVLPSGATNRLAAARRSPTVPKRRGSRVPHGTTWQHAPTNTVCQQS
jgi:SAM-dependent methyltransferase